MGDQNSWLITLDDIIYSSQLRDIAISVTENYLDELTMKPLCNYILYNKLMSQWDQDIYKK